MSTISTLLTDSIGKLGTPRSCVGTARARYDEERHPAKSYWRGLRNGIVGAHQRGRSVDGLTAVPSCVVESKATPYTQGVAGHGRFLGRKSGSWFEPQADNWLAHGLKVRPEPNQAPVAGRAARAIPVRPVQPMTRASRQAVPESDARSGKESE